MIVCTECDYEGLVMIDESIVIINIALLYISYNK